MQVGVVFLRFGFFGVFSWLVCLVWLFNTVIFSNVAFKKNLHKMFRKFETELLMDSPGLLPCSE